MFILSLSMNHIITPIKCKIKEGTFVHPFWECDQLVAFWNSVYSFVKFAMKREFDLNPFLCLLTYMADVQTDF